MQQRNYNKGLFLILIIINALPQGLLFFYSNNYNLPLLIISLVISCIIWFSLTRKKVQTNFKQEVITRAALLVASLQQAIVEKNLEDPLIAKKNANTQQLNTRLQISSIYLMTCIVGIRQSKSKTNYVETKQFNMLLEQLLPDLKKIYTTRGTKAERIPELIKNNYLKIKELIQTYLILLKKQSADPSIPIQSWFEEKSYINLADKPYIYRNLSKNISNDCEIKLLQALCRPKKHNTLLIKIKEKTETFIALLSQSNRYALHKNADIVDFRDIEKYLSAFLLIFGLVIIQESRGNSKYIESVEYQALKNKAINMIKAMIHNSSSMGAHSMLPEQIAQLSQFMEKQLPSLEAAYRAYFTATEQQSANTEAYLLDWFIATTETELSNKLSLPLALNQYVKQILAEE